MKGDFSAWRIDPRDDHLGVLYQQGRLIGDADLTEGEWISLMWRITAGRDIIGAHVAAVPAADPDGFAVTRAVVTGDAVELDLKPGRIWADGVHLTLPGPAPVTRTATYLPPPHNPAATATSQITDGTRDAVILEVSLEALNGFQDKDRLIEPALGGPDTTERIVPRTALKLLRLEKGETCANIGSRLRDDLSTHGHLTVELADTSTTAGDCPMVEAGGYAGFEHNLYRIEIAETDSGVPMFKWSQINGGLVGRGRFTGGPSPTVSLTANRAAILTSGLAEFYLEALEWDPDRGNWRVTYGTVAALNANGELDLTTPPTFGTLPGSSDPVFFRLWNGIRPVSEFTDAADPVELRDGIHLTFDAGAAAVWRPGSWWSFEVRAGEIVNPQTLLDDAPPEGPEIRRVPLAEITWSGRRDTDLGGEIEDCRRRFRPLSNQKICCTYIVGNGNTCFGDFNSLEEAARHLPAAGGRLCLLPGVHFANLELADKRGIEIVGCRHRSFVLPRPAAPAQPVIRVSGGQGIAIRDVDFVAPFGTAIALDGRKPALKGVRVEGCRIMALDYGIRAESVRELKVLDNRIWLLDHIAGISTISLRAEDALIEKNHVGVWPFEFKVPGAPEEDDEEPVDPAEPCIEPDDFFGKITAVLIYVVGIWTAVLAKPPEQPYRARGGIHVRGGSTGVDLRRNRIDGGLGHGITLGGILPGEGQDRDTGEDEEEWPQLKPTVEAEGGTFAAVVTDEQGAPIKGGVIALEREKRIRHADKTDDEGKVLLKAGDGRYDLAADPGNRIVRITRAEQDGVSVHQIVIARDGLTISKDPDKGFLTRIRILDNEIERMGLSGVGFWVYDLTPITLPPLQSVRLQDMAAYLSAVLAPRELLGTTNIVRDLVIRGNLIEGNLRAAFTPELTAASTVVAQGGVSLGLVEGLRIEDNHITGNGMTAANACAGIYVGYGEEVLISGNYIAGNGSVGADYRETRSDGLRSGIFIRLASSILAGGAEDSQHKPALVIRDNVVDQPAGRAVTAFAYGPVQCIGNTLNAQVEGAWNIFDGLVGTLLIVNIGGVHRLSGVANVLGADFTQLGQGRAFASIDQFSAKDRFNARVEMMLPGGETLVNSNKLRSGPDNRAWCPQLIATLDDLGYDGNQSSAFRPDLTYANLVAVANSLRVTDSRFRERAPFTAMSALTWTAGSTVSAGDASMNITTQNQGDHCIVALTNGSMPVVDVPNQVAISQFCPPAGSGDEMQAKRAYVLQTFLLAWARSVNPQIDDGLDGVKVEESLSGAVEQVQLMQVETGRAYGTEAIRLGADGAEDKLILARELEARQKTLGDGAVALRVQTELLAVKAAAPPAEGAVLDGRVADSAGRGTGKLAVELVDARGEALGPRAVTDDTGYYALELSPEMLERLTAQEDVFVRAVDAGGQELGREARPLVLGTARRISVDVALKRRPILTRPITGGTVIFDTVSRPVEPTDPVTPADPVRPNDPVRPDDPSRPNDPVRPPTPVTPRVELEAIPGIGRVIAERLREAGVTDAAALLALDERQLVEIVGNRAALLRRNAAAAIEAARGGNG